MVGPARQLVRQRETVLVCTRQQPVQQRLTRTLLEVAIEYIGHRIRALGGLCIVEAERHATDVPSRTVRSRTATDRVVPPGPDTLPDGARLSPLRRGDAVVGCHTRYGPVPRFGIEIEHGNTQGPCTDALIDDAPEHRVVLKAEQARVCGSRVPLPDPAVRAAGTKDTEILGSETGDAVHEEIEIGPLDESAIRRGGDTVDRVAGSLIVVVEVADIGPALDIRVLEVVIGDIQRDPHHIDQREHAPQPKLRTDQRGSGRRCDKHRNRSSSGQRIVDVVEHGTQRNLQRSLLEVMRVERGHVDVGDFGIPHAKPLCKLAVHHRPATVADQVQR